jgi:chromosomal replication initiator protein
MVDTVEKNLWREVLKLAGCEIEQKELETWLQPTRLASVGESELLVEVPNGFYKDFIIDQYSGILNEKASILMGRKASIKVIEATSQSELLKSQSELFNNGGKGKGQVVEVAPVGSEAPTRLNREYTFDTFVIGKSNQFCAAAAQAVAENPGKRYNPLFIYGSVGLGKTHLMQAIGHRLMKKDKSVRFSYLSADQFMNEMINAIKNNRPDAFRKKYRTADILLVDDIQYIAGKEGTQEEFFHTFNAVFEAGKQIVISSDRAPKDLALIEERLRNRFEWGLIADIQAPDYETRMAIIGKKADALGLDLPRNIADIIATRITTNIRAIEGALSKLEALVSLTGGSLTTEIVNKVLTEFIPEDSRQPTSIEKIQELVANYYGISKRDLVSKSRRARLAHARQIAMYLCRTYGNCILADIGAAFGNRDHSTVLHAMKKIEEGIKADGGKISSEVKELAGKIELFS